MNWFAKCGKTRRTLWNFGIYWNWLVKRICIHYYTHMWLLYILDWSIWTCLFWFRRNNQKMLVFTKIDELCQINVLWSDILWRTLNSCYCDRMWMNWWCLGVWYDERGETKLGLCKPMFRPFWGIMISTKLGILLCAPKFCCWKFLTTWSALSFLFTKITLEFLTTSA